MKKYLFCFIAALLPLFILTSCEEQEKVAQALYGTWEGDLGITHVYKGQTIQPVKCVFTFESNGISVGDGFLVEYYDLPELPVVYRSLIWETWTRQNGDVGVQINLNDEDVKYHIVDYHIDGQEFAGTYTSGDKTDIPFKLTRVANAPDVSNVKIWGYNELLPTWHPVTYEGWLYVLREYQGQTYQPSSVTITFDVDPLYNNYIVGFEKAYVRENYDDAPWGTYLADSIRHWGIDSSRKLQIYFANSEENWGDYQMWDVTVTADSLAGDIFVDTNKFSHFNLKRIPNPDWSTIKEWGIVNRLK